MINNLSDYTYQRDMLRRLQPPDGPYATRLAAHLQGHPLLSVATPVLAALKDGRDMSSYISPMARVKHAFKKATRNGDWSR